MSKRRKQWPYFAEVARIEVIATILHAEELLAADLTPKSKRQLLELLSKARALLRAAADGDYSALEESALEEEVEEVEEVEVPSPVRASAASGHKAGRNEAPNRRVDRLLA